MEYAAKMATTAQPRQAATVGSIKHDATVNLKAVRVLLSRVRDLADRLRGPEPQPGDAAEGRPVSGTLEAIEEILLDEARTLSDLENQVARLEGVIPPETEMPDAPPSLRQYAEEVGAMTSTGRRIR